MKVQIDRHTLERAKERGATAQQILDVIETGTPVEARSGRFAKTKLYGYYGLWKGRYYDQKMIKVIYVLERITPNVLDNEDVAVTITVIVKYGRWEEPL